ncbi:tyrosine-type recombinase/integrase [Streptomyces sp. R21]|uniref:Tyrosine-type recombinase/integrase n=1 Tax=Streptomyces sp. R21 TaxID=3238627 RepID=A0AB39PM79_9ACTN
MIAPANLTRTFNTLLRKAGLRRSRFRDLRHSAASRLLEQDIDLVAIKELLGHAQIGVTATIYTHVRLRLQRDDGADPSTVRSHRPLNAAVNYCRQIPLWPRRKLPGGATDSEPGKAHQRYRLWAS